MIILAHCVIGVSFLMLAAHCFRAGQPVLMALSLLWPLLLLLRRPWADKLVQAALLVGALEWLHTAVVFSRERLAVGAPFLRLALILGAVAFFTCASGLLLLLPSIRQRHGGR